MKIIIAENFLRANTLNRDDKQVVFLMCRGYSQRQYFISTCLQEHPRKGNFGVWILTFSTFFYIVDEKIPGEKFIWCQGDARRLFS